MAWCTAMKNKNAPKPNRQPGLNPPVRRRPQHTHRRASRSHPPGADRSARQGMNDPGATAGYIDGAGQILASDLDGRRTTFRLPDGVRPGDRVVIELTACGEVARMSTPGAATSHGAATGGARHGRGRGRGGGAGAQQEDGGRGAKPVQEASSSESEGYIDPSERTQVRVRKVRSDKGVKRGPRAGAVEDAVRMGPVW